MQLQNFNNFITLTYLNHIIIIRIINHFSYEGVQVVIKKVHKTHTHTYIYTQKIKTTYIIWERFQIPCILEQPLN